MKAMITALVVLLAAGPAFASSSHTRHVQDRLPDTQSAHGPQSGYYWAHRHEPRGLGTVIPGTAATQDAPPFHRGPWPIHNGFDQQPTQYELRALHRQDVTPDEAHEINRLYDQLLSSSDCPTGLRKAMAC